MSSDEHADGVVLDSFRPTKSKAMHSQFSLKRDVRSPLSQYVFHVLQSAFTRCRYIASDKYLPHLVSRSFFFPRRHPRCGKGEAAATSKKCEFGSAGDLGPQLKEMSIHHRHDCCNDGRHQNRDMIDGWNDD